MWWVCQARHWQPGWRRELQPFRQQSPEHPVPERLAHQRVYPSLALVLVGMPARPFPQRERQVWDRSLPATVATSRTAQMLALETTWGVVVLGSPESSYKLSAPGLARARGVQFTPMFVQRSAELLRRRRCRGAVGQHHKICCTQSLTLLPEILANQSLQTVPLDRLSGHFLRDRHSQTCLAMSAGTRQDRPEVVAGAARLGKHKLIMCRFQETVRSSERHI